MYKLRKYMVNALIKYGIFGAGLPSIHGSYESPVPHTLQTYFNK